MNDTLQTVLATTCYAYVGLPLDIVKLRMQTQGREGSYKGVLDGLRRIAKEEGLRGLGRGGTPGLASSMLHHPVTTAASGATKKALLFLQLQKQDDEFSLQSAVEMSIAQIVVSTAITVPENIKCKLQYQRGAWGQGEYRGPLHCAVKVAKREGVRGLFRGYSSVLLSDVPSAIVLYGAFQALVQALPPLFGEEFENERPLSSIFFPLACSAIASFGLLYPVDVVKSNMQTASSSNALTLRGTFRSVYSQQGLRGFYRGGSAAVLSAALSSSAFVAVFAGVGGFDELSPHTD